jgi:hypothetical protein
MHTVTVPFQAHVSHLGLDNQPQGQRVRYWMCDREDLGVRTRRHILFPAQVLFPRSSMKSNGK